jgi:hypothetical protein
MPPISPVLSSTDEGAQRWCVPPPRTLKINCDGAFIQDTLNGGWGFIIRDHAGAERLSVVPDALTAETTVCAKALQSATDFGISQIQLEMDSSVLKKTLLSSSMDLAATRMIIRDTRELLLGHFVYNDVLSVPRVCNSVAHELARMWMSWDPGDSCVWMNPSQNL